MTEMYSTCNEGKSVAAERFIRTLKQLCQKIFFDALNNIVDKYNNTYHNIIKIILILMLNTM